MNQQEKMADLKLRLAQFADRVDQLDPAETDIEEIDKLIRMLDELEEKIN
ncbi:SE1561 family protein [Salimicrobium halophilum]|uniref:Uncharacterized protein n=1 Tax=Salimicrobium halophilum TaxID=86666 RepID=A0A1G8U982_9BACI|nr:SE1561 family protein [Salimicrobium halophilum]SDJ49560.1 hypothetical protein SAMN04490247_2082 [Salimicrobium halophilum]